MARNNTDSNADDPLLAAFRLFYEAMMAAVPAATPGLPGADSPTVTPEASLAAASLQHQLVQLLELHTLGMRRAGGGRGGALVADALLLLRDWPGRSAWPQHLLETALFQSSVAGDKVFARIERLLSDREPSQRSLAQLYLFALALGFRGRLRGMDDAGQLAGLRRERFQVAHQRAPRCCWPWPHCWCCLS
jgi:type VI secretion system protein ImpK